MIEPTGILEGTLLPNGTVQLDEIPGIAPGRVTVTLKSEDWWVYLQQFRQANEARPETLRSAEEIQGDIAAE